LRRENVAVVAWDDRPRAALDASMLARLERDSGVTLQLEGATVSNAEVARVARSIDGVVVSPGVPAGRPLMRAARQRQVPIIGEVELAFAQLDTDLDTGTPPPHVVLAITGSNGKSTTTVLTGALLAEDGWATSVCGNFGPPLAGEVPSREAAADPHAFVVELSSFQLETVDTFRPRAAALLNLSPDHIDRHGDLASYLAAKARIFARQGSEDVAVLNADDPHVAGLQVAGRRRLFSRRGPVADGCYVDGEQVVESAPDQAPAALFAVSDVAIPGTHNLENAMAAALLARSLTVPADTIARALRGFRGLPHRLELVAEQDGVRFYDDSKGTNVGATIASLGGFADRSVHLILGGRAKGADFSALREPVATKARRVYLIGEAADALAEALGATPVNAGVTVEHAGTLERAVAAARRQARTGEAIVLSPACASFDQFAGFAERGRAFQRAVAASVQKGLADDEEAADGT
jgi:UDP-N-acetylmuramoylalanine--D-glutamate ligase